MRDELLAIEQFDTLLEPRSSWPTGERSTTTTVPTPPSGCSPQSSTPSNGGPTTQKNSHNEWTNNRGPVTRPRLTTKGQETPLTRAF